MCTSIRCYKVLNILKGYLRAWASNYVDKIAWSNCWRFYHAYTSNFYCVLLFFVFLWTWVSCCHFYIISSLVYFFGSFPIISSIVWEFIEKVYRKAIDARDISRVSKTRYSDIIITSTRMRKFTNVILFQLHNLVVKLVDDAFLKVCWGRNCALTASNIHIDCQYFSWLLVSITIFKIFHVNCEYIIHSFCNWSGTRVYP